MKQFVLGILFAVFAVSTAEAFTVTATGTIVRVSYTEPAVNMDNSPLTDLDHTTIYYDMGNGPVLALVVPASRATGGGNIAQDVTIPVLAGQQATVSFYATASDQSKNESDRSNTVVIRIDRLAPGPPQ
jgi:hypothetical protein